MAPMTGYTLAQEPHYHEEHALLAESLRAYVQRSLLPHARDWERAPGGFPSTVFREMGAAGFLGLNQPESRGGAGLDFWATVVFIDELLRCRMNGLTMGVLVQTNMATPIIGELGSPEQIDRYLKPAYRGERIAALAISEPGAGSDVAGIQTVARRQGDGWVVNGQKTFITNGARADFLTLLARTGGAGHRGLSLFLFDTATPGYRVGRALEKLGNHSSDTAELSFEDCRLGPGALLGQEGRGFYYVMQNFQEERLVAALMAVSAAQLALEDALAYVRQRQAFGRTLAEQPVLRHRLADMATRVEAARRLSFHAVERFQADPAAAIAPITRAKLLATETAVSVVDDALQLHGGYGYMEEYPICRAYRDIRLLTIGGGTSEVMREILAQELLDR